MFFVYWSFWKDWKLTKYRVEISKKKILVRFIRQVLFLVASNETVLISIKSKENHYKFYGFIFVFHDALTNLVNTVRIWITLNLFLLFSVP